MKSKFKPLPFIPTSRNFSEFRENALDSNNSDDPLEYDVSDKGVSQESVMLALQGDQILLSLLMGLDDREKIILMYQVLKELGFNLTQEEYARSLNFSRVYYTSLTRKLKVKCSKIIQGSVK